MPSPISFQATPPNQVSFPAVAPKNPPTPRACPLKATVHNSPSQMPVFPAHRKGPLPLPLAKGARLSSPSRLSGQQNGPRSAHSSSHSHSKRKQNNLASKDSHKKRSPLVMDRKQSVYNINKSSSSPRQRSSSAHNVKSSTAEKRSSSNTKEDLNASNKNICADSTLPGDPNQVGIFEPVNVKGDVRQADSRKRIEKDPDGRLYEVVQTRLVESKIVHAANVNLSNKRLSLPIVKSNTESQIPGRKVSSQCLSNLFSYSPDAATRYEMGGSEASNLNKDLSVYYSNKENIAKSLNTSPPYTPDRPTQEVIDRIKKNIERKEEFLKRPNEPIWKQTVSCEPIPKDYNVSPQKMQRSMWPPPQTQPHPSPGALSKALAFILGTRGEGQVLRRIKSEVESPRTVSFPSAVTTSLDRYNEEGSLTFEARSNSLPNSPTSASNDTKTHYTFPNTTLYSSLPGSSNPLTGNLVAKPYVSHLNEDGTPQVKYAKPFVSTLSRIHENISSTCKDSSTVSKHSNTALPSSTPVESQSAFISHATPGICPANRTVPILWIGDNERIRQLHIVSKRAKKFESPGSEKEGRLPTLHRYEVSRLSQRTDDSNVASRKKEFERRQSEVFTKDPQGIPFELGTSFDCSSRLKKMEDANWKGPKGVVKSLSDGGGFFAATKEFCLSPEVSCSTTYASTEMPILLQGTGNRMAVVGGPKIHCEPPDSKDLPGNRPDNDSDYFERFRTNSTCSNDVAWPSVEKSAPEKRRSPLMRQHSFHSTLHSHLARAVSSIQQRITSSDGTGTGSASTAGPTTGKPETTAGVSRRNKQLIGEENDRLVRRVSYLKATSGDRIYSDSDSEDEKPSSGASPANLARRAIGGQTHSSEDLPSPASFLASVTSNGLLHVKLAKLHGKRAGDRSWKTVWAVIRGRALLLYKDKHHATQTPLSPEEQVSLRGAEAGVASDYTKRRHVFRLGTPAGSQFLLQAESEPAMTAWLNSITVAASQDVEPYLKAMAPTPDSDSAAPYLDTAPIPMATITPTSSTASGSLCLPEAPLATFDGNVSPQTVPKNSKKITSPSKPKPPSAIASSAKGRKSTGEIGSSPKSKTWKGRLGRHLRKMQGTASLTAPSAPLPEGASIGVCLEDCPPSSENEFVPMLVTLCVNAVESKGLHIQGIYRIPGNRAAVTHLIETVNRGPKAVDLSDPRWSDVNVISSLLKQFFQRLPDPLIPSDLYPHFIEASKIDDPQQRIIELKNLVQELPDYHYETLRFLCFHLNHVTIQSTDNKMDVRNLAIVFGPTLVRAADDNMAKLVTDMSHQCRIVEMLISHAHWFFNEDDSEEPPPIMTTTATLNSLSVENATNSAEMEASSQSLLLGNVQKLEASHKDPKKLLVSSIISAANRRVQKVRKKMEEEIISSDCSQQDSMTSHYDSLLGQTDPLVVHQRRVSGPGSTTGSAAHMSSSHRNARIFGDSCNPLLDPDNRLDQLNSLHNLTATPFSASGGGVTATAGSLSKSEPAHLGEDLPIRSYTGLSASTQERIRRFEKETRAMLQRDVTRHRREVLDKQNIEQELQKAKKDLETEDIFDKLADNPSQVMHMVNDYCWSPSREAVSLPSLAPSAPSDPLTSHLAKSSLVPSAGITNASAKDDKLSQRETGLTPQRPHTEGSDLLSAINATFEKMKSLQSTPLIDAETNQWDTTDTSSCTSGPYDGNHIHRKESSIGSHSSGGSGSIKCKLYRDPSLHRRRTFNAAIKHSASTDTFASPDGGITERYPESSPSLSFGVNEQNDLNTKEKSEKRSRDILRMETQESFREKRPKELKRSDRQQELCDSPLGASTRKEKRESWRNTSELKSRKMNVKELMEKFESSGLLPTETSTVAPCPISSTKSPSTPEGKDKPTRASLKQARKARIKRRHTVGGMKDLARVAWLKVIEAANYTDPNKGIQGNQLSTHTTQLPSWEQLQLFLEAFAEERKMNVDQQAINSWVAREKLGSSTPDLDSILSLVLPPQQKEALKRRLSVREPSSVKSLHPVLESNV